MTLPAAPETIIAAYADAAITSNEFVISSVDDHVFIRIPRQKQHFWSPQLHLEIYKIEDQPTILKGLYGPSPTVWTLFIFLHFIIAILFIAAGIWWYTYLRLEKATLVPLLVMGILVIGWFGLYAAGRLGRKKGTQEMQQLQGFMYEILNNMK